MGGTVEDLLLLARAETGGLPTTKGLVTTSDFLEVVASKAILLGKAKHIQVKIVEGGAPPNFIAAENYLSLALGNLLSNAVKHSPENGTVTLTCKKSTEGAILFSVADQGEGIPKGLLEKIFDPFFRVDTARNRIAGGVGIGGGRRRMGDAGGGDHACRHALHLSKAKQ